MLARADCRVTIVSRRHPDFLFPADVENMLAYEFGDIGSADWNSLVGNADVVHYYAWGSIPASANSNARGDLIVNLDSILGLLEALRRRGQGRIVFSSSGGTVYGKLREIPVPEDHPVAPITAYGAGKATAEIYLGFYRAMYGMDCRIARIANPYGAGQNITRKQGAVTTFAHSALTGQPIEIWGTGDVVRDYIHIADLAAFLVTLSCSPRREDAHIFNVGTGIGTSLNEIVTMLETQLNRNLLVHRKPMRAFDVPISILSNRRAKDIFGWSPRISLGAGIIRTTDDLIAGRGLSQMDLK
jgi:UDP-glucose 4-epimerase